MHRTTFHFLALVPIFAALVLGGCTSDTGSGGDESNLKQAQQEGGPITLGNFVNHPKIVAIRTLVAEVDGLKLTESVTDGCDQSITAFRDPGGKIRRLKAMGGEGDNSFEWTDSYDNAGKLRFVFIRIADFTTKKATEQRVWIAEDGKTTLFQTVRDGTASSENPEPVITGTDRLPTETERFIPLGGQIDAEAGAKMTGC